MTHDSRQELLRNERILQQEDSAGRYFHNKQLETSPILRRFEGPLSLLDTADLAGTADVLRWYQHRLFQQEDPDVSVTYSSLNDELRTPFFRVYDFGDEPKRGSAPLATTENLVTPSGKTASELLGTFAGATPQKAAAIVDELHTTIAARPELTPAQRTQIDSILLDFSGRSYQRDYGTLQRCRVRYSFDHWPSRQTGARAR